MGKINLLQGNLLVGQSGGSTSVINNSLVGIIDEAKKHECIDKIYGMHFGIEGFMEENLIDLRKESEETLKGLRKTPGSALGSSRHKLKEVDLEPILQLFIKYNIRFFHMIGGNDTMDTIHRVTEYAKSKGYLVNGIGVPKTVDNDLFGTDHTPGYASCARAVTISVMQSAIFARDMARVDPVYVTQTVGRDAGWLAAATALARKKEGDGPHLIYIPERPLNWEKFKVDVKETYRKYGWVYIVNGEGIVDTDGRPVSSPHAQKKDNFGNIEFGSTGGVSAARELFLCATETVGVRGEYQQPESIPMCMADRMVKLDADEAYKVGRKAVQMAVSGRNGFMVTIVRKSNDPYKVTLGKCPLKDVAVHNKKMPDEYIAASGNDVTQSFLDYARPLVGELPTYSQLKMLK